MKTLMVVCGSGIATSTLAEGKIRDYLQSQGVLDQVKTYKGNVAEYINKIDDYDAFVSTTVVPDNVKDKVISGVPLLTGVGQDKVFEQVLNKLDLGK
ncbi:PTS sugar transporter subunit IIB [Secundilactobacillus kimchicus]|uniref:Phosphoenolpyruvate-dependent sugar phosphotransferase system EIIB.1 n=1 Tax=Secundilactobacillus kimchicus JCM 15530 TaxID=1302272 RepID=A0A0R1HNB2_9LACO|nr:PTS sugar transporter subunit IIB [Secundilactobacillus kimchicus]KRK48317.1 Phosphoenolpyruvate-dependent sugar phosphotransferase system EIIB.1 [Secundilactobacillus kimchicus JCM 15530]MBT9671083.1 PTS galactitol transporter subunit IIB [Secundilactobacillus kimchicus]